MFKPKYIMTTLKTITYLCLLFVIFSCKKKDEAQNFADGKYCFAFKDAVSNNTLELTITGNNVSGRFGGTIEDKVNSYYSSFDADFTGKKEGENLAVEVSLTVEGDVQKTTEKWVLSGNTLKMERDTYTKLADCSASTNSSSDVSGENTSTNATSFGAKPQFSWKIAPQESEGKDPRCFVDLVFNDKKYSIEVAVPGILQITDPKDYASLQIPTKSLSACSGYYAGGSTIFYVLPSNENEVRLIRTYLGEEGGKAIVEEEKTLKVGDFR